MHHKDFIGEDPQPDTGDDESCMMAMGRASSEAATSDTGAEQHEEEEAPPGQGGTRIASKEEQTGEFHEVRAEGDETNLDDELRETLWWKVGCSMTQKSRLASVTPTALRWNIIRRDTVSVDRPHPLFAVKHGPLGIAAAHPRLRVPSSDKRGDLPRLDVAASAASCSGTSHPMLQDPYPPVHLGEAMQKSQTLVDEATRHCDILGRLLQNYTGENMANEARARTHMARMEHSPV